MYETLIHSDNVSLFRMGTTPGSLSGVGADATNPGLSLELGKSESDANTIYQIWYANGALYLWCNGNLVFANDAANDVALDTGDTIVNGTATDGLSLCELSGSAFVDSYAYKVGDLVKPT